MSCENCIDKIIYVSKTFNDKTTAQLKDKPLCDKGFKEGNYYYCDKIKTSYHRIKR